MTPAVTISGPSGPLSTGGGDRQPPTGCPPHAPPRRFVRTDEWDAPVVTFACPECGQILDQVGGGDRGE